MSITISDIKFRYEAKTAETLGPADATVSGNDLETELGLENCVLISLGTNARAGAGDKLPEENINRDGFWGSELLGFNLGSKSWLLGRSKITPEVVALAEQYENDALKWMVNDGIVSAVETTAVRAGVRQISVEHKLIRPSTNVFFTYYLNWENQLRG